jgi:hypothetical protein
LELIPAQCSESVALSKEARSACKKPIMTWCRAVK